MRTTGPGEYVNTSEPVHTIPGFSNTNSLFCKNLICAVKVFQITI